MGWIPYIIKADVEQIIPQNGLDAYMYIRFLRLMIIVRLLSPRTTQAGRAAHVPRSAQLFVPFWLISWALLLPIYGAQAGGTKTGLDRFTFGNVGLNKQPRYAAPLILVWFFACELPHPTSERVLPSARD